VIVVHRSLKRPVVLDEYVSAFPDWPVDFHPERGREQVVLERRAAASSRGPAPETLRGRSGTGRVDFPMWRDTLTGEASGHDHH